MKHSCYSIYTQKNYHCYGHLTADVGDLVRNYCMAFYGYHGSKCTEDKDAIQKYLFYWQEMGNTSARAIIFSCKTDPNAKDSQKLGTIEICIIRKKKEKFCLMFVE